jgi:hypothetical protein
LAPVRLVLTGLVSATAAVLGGSAGAATAASSACAPAGAQIKLSNSRAQVYALSKAIYACDRSTRRTTKLGQTTICNVTARVDNLALAGDVVAYGLDRCGVDTGSTTVVVRRTSDGTRLHSLAAITGPSLVESYQSINALVVTAKGAVAWIATDSSIIGRGKRIEVHANGRLLDSGPAIKVGSLRLHGSKLSWRDGAKTRTARL